MTFKDLLYLTQQKSAKGFLIPKGFNVWNYYGPSLEMYDKNRDSKKRELVEFAIKNDKRYVTYETSDTAYVHSILLSLYKQYKLIFKDTGSPSAYYQLGDSHTNINVDITNKPSGRVSVNKTD